MAFCTNSPAMKLSDGFYFQLLLVSYCYGFHDHLLQKLWSKWGLCKSDLNDVSSWKAQCSGLYYSMLQSIFLFLAVTCFFIPLYSILSLQFWKDNFTNVNFLTQKSMSRWSYLGTMCPYSKHTQTNIHSTQWFCGLKCLLHVPLHPHPAARCHLAL